MRYKKKKRQIVSAALAAMMAMQLCIPSATFAAVPTKKLKVITGFTELPEEVAHIQIPADAGENFEDYLNFPETIEASVVEYKNVDHQKNNADRDKGAEDEKAAADDRDKKEDSEKKTPIGWTAPSEVLVMQGPWELSLVSGQSVLIPNATLLSNPAGKLTLTETSKIEVTLEVAMPEDGSQPYGVFDTEAIPDEWGQYKLPPAEAAAAASLQSEEG